MPDINVEVEVYCSCGEGLCGQSKGGNTRGRGQAYIEVEPCKKCMDGRYDEGYKEAESKEV